MSNHEQLVLSFERQRNQIFTELHETQSSVVSHFRKSDKRAERLDASLRAARNRLAKSLVETRGRAKKNAEGPRAYGASRVDHRLGGSSGGGAGGKAGARGSGRRGGRRRPGGAPLGPGGEPIWQRSSNGGAADDPSRATLSVVDSYVRYQALFLGGAEYKEPRESEEAEHDEIAAGVLARLKKLAATQNAANGGPRYRDRSAGAAELLGADDGGDDEGGGGGGGALGSGSGSRSPASGAITVDPPSGQSSRAGSKPTSRAGSRRASVGVLAGEDADGTASVGAGDGAVSPFEDPDGVSIYDKLTGRDKLSARERAEQDREAKAKKAVLDSMPAPLRVLRRAIIVSACVAKWRALVRRRRLARELKMRRSYLTSLESVQAESERELARKSVLSAVTVFAKKEGISGSALYEKNAPAKRAQGGSSAPATSSARPRTAAADLGAGSRSASGASTPRTAAVGLAGVSGGTVDVDTLPDEARAVFDATKRRQRPATAAAAGARSRWAGGASVQAHDADDDLSPFPQLQLRPTTTPRHPRRDIIEVMAHPDPASIEHHNMLRRQADELERYRAERVYNRSVKTNTLFTSEGELSQKAVEGIGHAHVFTPASIRLRVLRETDKVIADAAGPRGRRHNHHRRSRSRPGSTPSGSSRPGLPPRPPTSERPPRPASSSALENPGARGSARRTRSARRRPPSSLSAGDGGWSERPRTAAGAVKDEAHKPIAFQRATTPRGRTPMPQGLIRSLSGHS